MKLTARSARERTSFGPARWFDENAPGVDVAFCPERVAQGYAVREIFSLPQLVSGATPSRGDIAGRLNEKGYTYSGFALRMPGVKLAPGAHVLDLRVVTSAGDSYDVAGAATFTTR